MRYVSISKFLICIHCKRLFLKQAVKLAYFEKIIFQLSKLFINCKKDKVKSIYYINRRQTKWNTYFLLFEIMISRHMSAQVLTLPFLIILSIYYFFFTMLSLIVYHLIDSIYVAFENFINHWWVLSFGFRVVNVMSYATSM